MRNAEFLFVDDESSDDSLEILKRAAERDRRIQVIPQKRSNAGAARNRGLDAAKGKYVIFLDSDDTFDPNLLTYTVDRAERYDAQVVIFNADILQLPEGTHLEPDWMNQTRVLPRKIFAGRDAADHLFQMLNPWTKLYRREYILREGFRYQSQYSTNDAYFTMMALSCAERIITLPARLVHYHTGRSGNIQSKKDRAPLDAYNAFLAARRDLRARGILDAFDRALAIKAAESMIRELNTQKKPESRQILYNALQNGGLSALGFDAIRQDPDARRVLGEKLNQCEKILTENWNLTEWSYWKKIKAQKEISTSVDHLQDMVIRMRLEKEKYESQILSMSSRISMNALHMAEHGILPPQDNVILFSDFYINASDFSCIVKSSKRSNADRICFSLTPAVQMLHPDAIACALATLCGEGYHDVYLDLVISVEAKAQLETFTNAVWHTRSGSIPAYNAPDEKDGILLNFSGGFDSLAAKALLPENTELIAVDFGGWFQREADFFERFSPHILKTNFRQLKYDRETWTFMGAGALLFSNALNCKYNVFGTIFEANEDQINDHPLNAASVDTLPFSILGMKDIRLTNGLTEVGTAMVVTHFYPDIVLDSLKSLAAAGSEKLYRKQVLLNIICNKYHRQISPVEYNAPDTKNVSVPFGTNYALDFLALYELKNAGEEIVHNTVTDIPADAYALAEKLSLRFYERLNPSFLHTVPDQIRPYYLDRLHEAGIVEFDDDDWNELHQVRQLLAKYYPNIKA